MYRLRQTCPRCEKAFLGPVPRGAEKVRCPHCGEALPESNPSADEQLWLIAKAKRESGPFTTSQLTELATSRQLFPADMLRPQGAPNCVEAGSLPGLFGLAEDEHTPKVVLDFTKPEFPPLVTAPAKEPAYAGPHFNLRLADFRIQQKLGEGGMGAVYLALQRSTVRNVALKVLSQSLASKGSFVSRFLREAEILSALDHPNIVKFIGFGEEKGIPFFAMEFIEGVSTSLLVKRRGPMAVGDALCIFRQSADALSYALKHKIVHRDIKPENLMLTRAGQVKLTDLGLAKSLDLPAGTSLDLTDTGTGMGSPKYSAPEQTHNAKFVDQRADIYALGGTLYFLLTTDAPFKGSTALELLSAKEKNSFTPARRLNADVPPRLDLMIDKMLARDPRQRYRDYDELLHDVDALGMTNPRLSFDPSEVVPMGQSMLLHQAVQILLIDDDADDIRLARQGLEENGICSNLTALTDGAQARAYLRREGPFLVAQQPDLIIFGSKLRLPDLLLTLEEIKASDALSEIPLVVLADSAKTSEFLQTCGYKVNLIVSVPTEPDQFNDLFKSIRGLWVTVMEFKSDS